MAIVLLIKTIISEKKGNNKINGVEVSHESPQGSEKYSGTCSGRLGYDQNKYKNWMAIRKIFQRKKRE